MRKIFTIVYCGHAKQYCQRWKVRCNVHTRTIGKTNKLLKCQVQIDAIISCTLNNKRCLPAIFCALQKRGAQTYCTVYHVYGIHGISAKYITQGPRLHFQEKAKNIFKGQKSFLLSPYSPRDNNNNGDENVCEIQHTQWWPECLVTKQYDYLKYLKLRAHL